MSQKRPARPASSLARFGTGFLAGLAIAVVAAGCHGVVGLDPEQVRVEVTAALEAYYPKLAAAYADQDPSHLKDIAVRKELAHVDLRIDEMADRGERIVSDLRQFVVETVRVARSTAYVVTTEIWDIELVTSGSDRVLQSYPGQRYRVRYQMKLENGVWRVVFRNLTETPVDG